MTLLNRTSLCESCLSAVLNQVVFIMLYVVNVTAYLSVLRSSLAWALARCGNRVPASSWLARGECVRHCAGPSCCPPGWWGRWGRNVSPRGSIFPECSLLQRKLQLVRLHANNQSAHFLLCFFYFYSYFISIHFQLLKRALGDSFPFYSFFSFKTCRQRCGRSNIHPGGRGFNPIYKLSKSQTFLGNKEVGLLNSRQVCFC